MTCATRTVYTRACTYTIIVFFHKMNFLMFKGHLRILQDELFGKWKVLLTSSSDPLPVSSLSRVTSLLSECGLLSPDLWAEVFLRGSQALDNKDDLLSIIQSLLDDYSSCSSAIEKVHNYSLKINKRLTTILVILLTSNNYVRYM